MIVSKKIPDEKMVSLKNTFIKPSQIDTILDKINQLGYENLTDEEKKFLSEASKEDI